MLSSPVLARLYYGVVFGVVILLGPALCGAFCLVCASAVLAQGSRPVKCFVSGGIEQKNGGIEQVRRGGRDDIPCATTEMTNGDQVQA